MLFKVLKEQMLLPNKEIIINKAVKIRGLDAVIACITSQNEKNVLWVIYHQPICHDDEAQGGIELLTNRDEMINSISNDLYPHIHISEIMIQDQKMLFSSSRTGRICGNDYEVYMQLQHFVEHGIAITNFDEADLSDIVIAAYEQAAGQGFPNLDLSKELSVTLKVDESSKRMLINQPVSLKFGAMRAGEKRFFYDSIHQKQCTYYLNKLEHYDIWENTKKQFNNNEGMQNLTKEQIEAAKNQFLSSVENICPRGMDLAMLEYETEDDVQLDFYSKEYLDEKPVHSSSSSAMFFISDKKLGNNGFKSGICMIKPVAKDFNGTVDVELFSWLMKMPEEIIKV